MPAIIPHLWFADNNAREAVEYYCSIFPNSTINHIEYYPDEHLDEHFEGMTGKVLTAEFELDGRPFMAIDGGPYYRFNETISLVVPCGNQARLITTVKS